MHSAAAATVLTVQWSFNSVLTVAVTTVCTSQMQRANALPQLTLASAAAPAPAAAAAVVGAKANNTFQFGLAFDRVRTATPASCCLVWSA